jgi:hypothetical protein
MCPIGSVSHAVHVIMAGLMIGTTSITTGFLLLLRTESGIRIIVAVVSALMSTYLLILMILSCECGMRIGYAILESLIGISIAYLNLGMHGDLMTSGTSKEEFDNPIYTPTKVVLSPARTMDHRRILIKI